MPRPAGSHLVDAMNRLIEMERSGAGGLYGEALRLARTMPTCAYAWKVLAENEAEPGTRLGLFRRGVRMVEVMRKAMGGRSHGPRAMLRLEILRRDLLRTTADEAEMLGMFDIAIECLEELCHGDGWEDAETVSRLLGLAFVDLDIDRSHGIVEYELHGASAGWMRIVHEILAHGLIQREEIDLLISQLTTERLASWRGSLIPFTDPDHLLAVATNPQAFYQDAVDLWPAFPVLKALAPLREQIATAIREYVPSRKFVVIDA